MLLACEQDEEERACFWESVEQLREAAPRLVFIDETGFNIDMERRCGRAPKGERVISKVPCNTPENLSFVGALAPEGIIAGLELEGPVDGLGFVAFLERCLVPVLRPEDVVIMDNLSTHCSEAVVSLIEAAGAWVLYLPAYSPDYNPIEQCFSKIKELVRGIAARTRRKLSNAITKAINAVTPADAKGWFENIGYWITPNCKPL